MPTIQVGNALLLVSDPTLYRIQVDGKIFTFEWHHYCGPIVVTDRGEPAATQPKRFLYAASLWAQQGRKIEDSLCVWYHEPKEILKHLGGRQWLITGYEPPVRGS